MTETTLPWFLTLSDPKEAYFYEDFVALDLETDSEENGSALLESNDIVLACWYVYKDGKCVKRKEIFGGIYDMAELVEDVRAAKFLLAMNAKFEAQWLRRCGLDLHDILVYDPMLAQWVLDGNQKGKGFERSLRGMAIRYGTRPKLDIVGKLLDTGVSTRDINSEWLLEYCWRDVDTMLEIFYQQRQVVTDRNVWHLVHTRNLTCTCLADTEFAGLELDEAAVNAEYIKVKQRVGELGDELAVMTGGINLGSPVQLAKYLYTTLKFAEVKDYKGKPIRTNKGEKSTAATTLAQLKAETEEQQQFLLKYKEYNKQVSLLEKNLEFFKLVCEYEGGNFKGIIKQNATETHRLASSGRERKFPVGKKNKKTGAVALVGKKVQLQNIPREYKGLFYARKDDWVVCSYDSSQVEFRMAVDMGRDKVGYAEISTGTDIHEYTAQELTNAGEPTTRQEAKAKTFRPLFGGSSGSPALQAYCQFFKDKYEGIASMQQQWALTCADQKCYTTPYGMTFYLPAEVRRNGSISHSTKIYNFPIQGISTGEVIPIALVHFWHKTRYLLCELFVTIHDSIDARVHKDDVEAVDEIAIQALTTDVYEYLNRVYKYRVKTPLGLGLKHGKHWGEGKEVKFDVTINGERIKR